MKQPLRMHRRSVCSGLLALCLALDLLFALASPAGAAGSGTSAFSVPAQEGVALAQVATVRVVAHYTLDYSTPLKPDQNISASVTCTGLGVLVQSPGPAGTPATTTYLLTSSEVLASDLACPQVQARVLPPRAIVADSTFSGGSIYLSRAYVGTEATQDAAAAAPLFSLPPRDSDLQKAPSTPQAVLVRLTPATGSLPHDYPTVVLSTSASSTQVLLDLRSASNASLTNDQLNVGLGTPTPALKASDFLSTTTVPAAGAGLVGSIGAPVIDPTSGAVEGLLQSDGTVLSLTSVSLPNDPNTCPGNPANQACLTALWKAAMDAYYGPTHDLSKLRALATNATYGDFGGARDFLNAALALQSTPTPTPNKGNSQAGSLNLGAPVTIGLIVLVILLIGVFVMTFVIVARARRRQAQLPAAASFSQHDKAGERPIPTYATPPPTAAPSTFLQKPQVLPHPQGAGPSAAQVPSKSSPPPNPPPAPKDVAKLHQENPPAQVPQQLHTRHPLEHTVPPVKSRPIPSEAAPAAGTIAPATPPASPAKKIFCPQCGLQQEIGSSPCPRCGYDLRQALTLVRGKGPNAPAVSPPPPRPARVPANADAPLPFAVAADDGQKLPDQEGTAAQKGPLSGLVLGGKYELQELLGRGGVGAVYKAYNRLLKRPQAIKVLLEHYGADPKFQERFRREAQTLAALDHANILPVHDFGVEENRAYLVMPFISGGTLHQFLQQHPDLLGFEQVRRALGHIAAALDHAHAQGVVHLDLKPANVLLHPDGRLLLSDFGLAHLLEAGAVEGGTSLQFGTPAYMAPEHIEGQPEAASDIYALGIILYQLLTGKVPFQGSSPLAILRKQATEPPPALRVSRPELPVALESVLGKALAKEPAARYQTAGALLSAFQSVVSAS